MRILALERESPGAEAQDFKRLGTAEARAAWELYQSDVIRELYFRQDENSAVLVLECSTLDDARAALARLPFVEAGLITFDLIPLKPYPGFERLFSDE